MASAIIHMAVASELNKKIKRKESEYFIGSIAPDIAKIVGIDRNITHFKKQDDEYPDLDSFLLKYEQNLSDDFVMGYYIHLLTDYFWYKYFFTEIFHNQTVKKLDGTIVKVDKEEMKRLIYNDYTNLNIQVIEEYNLNLKIFYNEIPYIKDIIKEIPIEKIDKLIDKMGVIIENSKKSTSYTFDISEVKTFITTCVDLITAILAEKGLIKTV